MAEVYWIRLPEHTDMFTEGYIGVTTKTSKERFIEHVKASKLKKKKHLKISYAIKKYKPENMIVQTLVVCDESYALELEEKLRPSEEIGWNLAKGGSKPPVRKGPMPLEFSEKLSIRNKGVPKSEDTKRKISKSLMGHKYTTPESREKARQTYCRNYIDGDMVRKPKPESAVMITAHSQRKAVTPEKEFWTREKFNIWSKVLDKRWLCSQADKLFSFYKELDSKVSCKLAANHLGLDGENKTIKRNIGLYLSYFKSGWNPKEDPDWVREFEESLDGTCSVQPSE